MKFVEVSKLVALLLCLGAADASGHNEQSQLQVDIPEIDFFLQNALATMTAPRTGVARRKRLMEMDSVSPTISPKLNFF